MKKSFAVVGLGRFGTSVAIALMNAGAEVLAIDSDTENVKRIAPFVTCALNIDVCDTDALREAGLDAVDVLVVAMGTNLEASAMTIITAKEIGVPYILAKSNSDEASKILKKIGADKVVYPEKDAGASVARKLLSSNFIEFFGLTDEINVAEIDLKPQWIGKTIKQLNLRKNYGINIIAVKLADRVLDNVDPDMVLDVNSRLIITISNKDIKRLM